MKSDFQLQFILDWWRTRKLHKVREQIAFIEAKLKVYKDNQYKTYITFNVDKIEELETTLAVRKVTERNLMELLYLS